MLPRLSPYSRNHRDRNQLGIGPGLNRVPSAITIAFPAWALRTTDLQRAASAPSANKIAIVPARFDLKTNPAFATSDGGAQNEILKRVQQRQMEVDRAGIGSGCFEMLVANSCA